MMKTGFRIEDLGFVNAHPNANNNGFAECRPTCTWCPATSRPPTPTSTSRRPVRELHDALRGRYHYPARNRFRYETEPRPSAGIVLPNGSGYALGTVAVNTPLHWTFEAGRNATTVHRMSRCLLVPLPVQDLCEVTANPRVPPRIATTGAVSGLLNAGAGSVKTLALTPRFRTRPRLRLPLRHHRYRRAGHTDATIYAIAVGVADHRPARVLAGFQRALVCGEEAPLD
jgi:hypothetical protein